MDRSVHDELMAIATEWDRAMIENDADAIGRYMADDWTIVGSDGSLGDKATFLGLVKSGALSHDVMTSDDLRVRVYGDAAVVTARGVSGGKYQGQPFREVERSSCVFVRQEGQWRCVFNAPLTPRAGSRSIGRASAVATAAQQPHAGDVGQQLHGICRARCSPPRLMRSVIRARV